MKRTEDDLFWFYVVMSENGSPVGILQKKEYMSELEFLEEYGEVYLVEQKIPFYDEQIMEEMNFNSSPSNQYFHELEEYVNVESNRESISVLKASKILGCSVSTIYRMIESKRISAFNVGERLTRVYLDEIEALMT